MGGYASGGFPIFVLNFALDACTGLNFEAGLVRGRLGAVHDISGLIG